MSLLDGGGEAALSSGGGVKHPLKRSSTIVRIGVISWVIEMELKMFITKSSIDYTVSGRWL